MLFLAFAFMSGFLAINDRLVSGFLGSSSSDELGLRDFLSLDTDLDLEPLDLLLLDRFLSLLLGDGVRFSTLLSGEAWCTGEGARRCGAGDASLSELSRLASGEALFSRTTRLSGVRSGEAVFFCGDGDASFSVDDSRLLAAKNTKPSNHSCR